MMFKSDDGHDALQESVGSVMRQEDDTVESIASHTNGDILNYEGATPSAVKDKSCAEKEVQGTKQQDYTKTSRKGAKTDPHQAKQAESAPSNASLSSTASSSAVDTSDGVLSGNSAASSIKRSFEFLDNMDLSIKNVRDPSASFFFGVGMYAKEWSQDEKESLVAFAKRYIIRGSNRKEHDDCFKKRRTVG